MYSFWWNKDFQWVKQGWSNKGRRGKPGKEGQWGKRRGSAYTQREVPPKFQWLNYSARGGGSLDRSSRRKNREQRLVSRPPTGVFEHSGVGSQVRSTGSVNRGRGSQVRGAGSEIRRDPHNLTPAPNFSAAVASMCSTDTVGSWWLCLSHVRAAAWDRTCETCPLMNLWFVIANARHAPTAVENTGWPGRDQLGHRASPCH